MKTTARHSAFFAGLSWLLIILTIGLMAALLVFLFRYKHHTWMSRTSCVLIIAGGIGNLIDRFIFGYVVDYIHVLFFPDVFNFADCCVVVGAILFAVCTYSLKTKKKRQIKK